MDIKGTQIWFRNECYDTKRNPFWKYEKQKQKKNLEDILHQVKLSFISIT